MDSRRFISVIKEVVRDAAVRDTLRILEHPPGRRPPTELRDRAEWYGSLDDDQRRLIEGIVAQAVDTAVFGILSVLDGVRAAESGAIKGNFELRYVKDGVTLLNPPNGTMLHDLYKATD
jgi:hypothetical protein